MLQIAIHLIYPNYVQKQWFIRIPITNDKGVTTTVQMFADPGANAACIKTDYAVKNFKNFIKRNVRNNTLHTGGGSIRPKYVLHLSFPAKDGRILKARMYLVDGLPVDILADINMLEAFGYKFEHNQLPPVFRHQAAEPLDLELKDQDEAHQINFPYENEFERYTRSKINAIQFQNNSVVTRLAEPLFAELYGGRQVLSIQLSNSSNHEPKTRTVRTKTSQTSAQSKISLTKTTVQKSSQSTNSKTQETDANNQNNQHNNISTVQNDFQLSRSITDINMFKFDPKNTFHNLADIPLHEATQLNTNITEDIISHVAHVNAISNNSLLNRVRDTVMLNQIKRQTKAINTLATIIPPTHSFCLFILAKHSFLASPSEIAQAKRIGTNVDLKLNDYSYLKDYEKLYGARFKGLYEAVMLLIEQYRHCFATKQFDRKTWKVPPQRLGIKPEHRSKTMYAPQYPINAVQRLHMINYVFHNQQNGFLKPVSRALHCIPFTMVGKKNSAGVFTRWRPAWDGRIINQYCYLMQTNMPTLQDFHELHALRGLLSCFDFKNCFDCIPLHILDQIYAITQTPLGLYQMTCLTYGWKNSAPCAQNLNNQCSADCGNTLTYLDDGCMKHLFEWGTKQIVAHLERLFIHCEKYNKLLNPVKFWPACTKVVSLSEEVGLYTRRLAPKKKQKILLTAEPTTYKQLQSWTLGLQYHANKIKDYQLKRYWIDKMEKAQPKKKGKIHWTPEGRLAYKQLQHLVANSAVLHHPTTDGKYALKCDACNYGVGAVLYQYQFDHTQKKHRWCIVDLWSKILPKSLRHCHSHVHEAYGLVASCEHWQFQLMKGEFIVATDNKPVAHIFDQSWYPLSAITQQQLLRLRIKMNMFSFEARHVPGLDNHLADGLSRFTIELIEKHKNTEMALKPIKSDDTLYTTN